MQDMYGCVCVRLWEYIDLCRDFLIMYPALRQFLWQTSDAHLPKTPSWHLSRSSVNKNMSSKILCIPVVNPPTKKNRTLHCVWKCASDFQTTHMEIYMFGVLFWQFLERSSSLHRFTWWKVTRCLPPGSLVWRWRISGLSMSVGWKMDGFLEFQGTNQKLICSIWMYLEG